MAFDTFDYQMHFELLAKEWEKDWPIFVYNNTYPLCASGVRPSNWLGPLAKNISKEERKPIHWETQHRSAISFNLYCSKEVCERVYAKILKDNRLYYALTFKNQLATNCPVDVHTPVPAFSTVRTRSSINKKMSDSEWVTQSSVKLNGSADLENITLANWFVALREWCPTGLTVQDILQGIFIEELPENHPNVKSTLVRLNPLSKYNIRAKSSHVDKHKQRDRKKSPRRGKNKPRSISRQMRRASRPAYRQSRRLASRRVSRQASRPASRQASRRPTSRQVSRSN